MDFAMFEKIANNNCSEDGVAARFYDRAIKTGEIGESGLPKFGLTCFCEIRIKDNNSEIYDQPVTEDKIRRFPAEYARYQMSKQKSENGTPLEQFAFLDRAEVETLKAHGIFTVEALVEMNDDKVNQLDLGEEQSLAKKFLQQAKNNAVLKNWQKKEEEYLQKIKLLEEQIAELGELKKTKETKISRRKK